MVPEDDILPPDEEFEEEEAEEAEEEEEAPPVRLPDQLIRDGRIPFDHSTGAEYQSGEVPLGWSEPLP